MLLPCVEGLCANEGGAAQQLFFSDENRKELLELLGTDYISYESVSVGHFLLSLLILFFLVGYFLASDNFQGPWETIKRGG